MNLKNILLLHYNKIQKRRSALQREISKLPDGSLKVNKNGRYAKFFKLESGKRTYIPSSDTQIVTALAKKLYMEKELIDAERELYAIEQYILLHSDVSEAQLLLEQNKPIADILTPLLPKNDKYRSWMNEDYPSSAGYEKALIHKGPLGKMFRSKTEANIAYLLSENNIPFRYEWNRVINGITYPIDFTVIDTKSDKFIYWEHFGKMGSPSYAVKIGSKLSDFESAGIFPGINLILTFESERFRINISQLEEIVQQWFL